MKLNKTNNKMTKFKHACFVRVEDAERRENLTEWLETIGYNHLPFIRDSSMLAVNNDLIWLTDANREGGIDCENNIECFKTIAAINDENDYLQWFISEEAFSQGIEVFGIGTCFQLSEMKFDNSIKAYKATPEELIEKFKNK